MKKSFFIFLFLYLLQNLSFADFKEIKKKALVTNPEIIFPIQRSKKNCVRDLYVSPDTHYVRPVLNVEAP